MTRKLRRSNRSFSSKPTNRPFLSFRPIRRTNCRRFGITERSLTAKRNVFFSPTPVTKSEHFWCDEVQIRIAIAFLFCPSFFLYTAFPPLVCSFLFRASPHAVTSIEIKETEGPEGKRQFAMSQKKFDSIPELISFYKTYDFSQVSNNTNRPNSYRLTKALPRPTWQEELIEKQWYQPSLSREQADQLLCGVSRSTDGFVSLNSLSARRRHDLSHSRIVESC